MIKCFIGLVLLTMLPFTRVQGDSFRRVNADLEQDLSKLGFQYLELPRFVDDLAYGNIGLYQRFNGAGRRSTFVGFNFDSNYAGGTAGTFDSMRSMRQHGVPALHDSPFHNFITVNTNRADILDPLMNHDAVVPRLGDLHYQNYLSEKVYPYVMGTVYHELGHDRLFLKFGSDFSSGGIGGFTNRGGALLSELYAYGKGLGGEMTDQFRSTGRSLGQALVSLRRAQNATEKFGSLRRVQRSLQRGQSLLSSQGSTYVRQGLTNRGARKDATRLLMRLAARR